MCAAEHSHIFVWNVCRVKLNSALKRAENKLTLNVKFIEMVYVAVGPLKMVVCRYEKLFALEI